MKKNQSSSKYQLALFCPSLKSYGEIDELLLKDLVKLEIQLLIIAPIDFTVKQKNSYKIDLNPVLRKVHALYHSSLLWRKRDLTIAYKLRALSAFGSKAQQANSKNFMGFEFAHNSKLKRYIVKSFSTKIGIVLLKFVITELLFRLQYLISYKNLSNFDLFLFSYGGRTSVEEDFLLWACNQKEVDTIAIQENWDNLSSKKFLFQYPKTFITWGPQSTFHLRKFHNYQGEVREFGSMRLNQFYQHNSQKRSIQPRRNLQKIESNASAKIGILLIGTGDGTHDSDLLKSAFKFISNCPVGFKDDFFFIYRPHPYTRNRIGDDNLISYQGKILVDIPRSDESNDYRFNLLEQVAIVVSLYSTVILEASILNKVMVIPSYIAKEYPYSTHGFLQESEHFRALRSLVNLHNFVTEDDFFSFLLNFEGVKPDEKRLTYVNYCCSEKNTSKELIQFLLEKLDLGNLIY